MKNNKFLESKEGSAFVKLILWIIFIVVLLVMFSFNNKEEKENTTNNSNDTTKEVTTFKTLEEMENNLLSMGLTYKYTVNENGFITIYNGIRCNNVETYYKEDGDVISKYILENGKTYKVVLDKKEEIILEEKTLKDLFTTLKEYSYTEEKQESERTIKYNTGTLKVSIKTNLENITEISIAKDGINYQLEFTNTRICDNID